jgi:hypothetical protein
VPRTRAWLARFSTQFPVSETRDARLINHIHHS